MMMVHRLEDLSAQHVERLRSRIVDIVSNNPARFQMRVRELKFLKLPFGQIWSAPGHLRFNTHPTCRLTDSLTAYLMSCLTTSLISGLFGIRNRARFGAFPGGLRHAHAFA